MYVCIYIIIYSSHKHTCKFTATTNRWPQLRSCTPGAPTPSCAKIVWASCAPKLFGFFCFFGRWRDPSLLALRNGISKWEISDVALVPTSEHLLWAWGGDTVSEWMNQILPEKNLQMPLELGVGPTKLRTCSEMAIRPKGRGLFHPSLSKKHGCIIVTPSHGARDDQIKPNIYIYIYI